VGGRPTYLVGLLHVLVIGAFIVVLGRAVYLAWREGRQPWRVWCDRLIGRSSGSAFTQNAALWGFGLVLTLSSLPLHRHYMIILFPLEFLWLARMALAVPSSAVVGNSETLSAFRPGRVLLAGLFVVQLLITAGFLHYIHQTGGSMSGDYGLVYRMQVHLRRMNPEDFRKRQATTTACPKTP
jgi:hypothetical protein